MFILLKLKTILFQKLSKKEDGYSSLSFLFTAFLLTSIIGTYIVAIDTINFQSRNFSKAVTSSGLAALSLVYQDESEIDLSALEKYATENIIEINAPKALLQFKKQFSKNINLTEVLTDKWSGEDAHIFDFSNNKYIELVDFYVYNVKNNNGSIVITTHYYHDGAWSQYDSLTVITPDGTLVENTSVYCAFNVPLKTYFNVKEIVRVKKYVSIS